MLFDLSPYLSLNAFISLWICVTMASLWFFTQEDGE